MLKIFCLYTLLYIWRVCQKSQVVRPEGAEALIMNAFALTGRIIIISVYPGRCQEQFGLSARIV